MSIESIRIQNVLSFESFEISDFKDINCILGANNAGKSNLMKCVSFFYKALSDERELPPTLLNNYSYYGTISISFDVSRLISIAKKYNTNNYFKHILKTISDQSGFFEETPTIIDLTLKIYSDNKITWSTKDRNLKGLILYIFPFFYIEPRHMDLHKWDDIWNVISSIKPFKLSNIDTNKVIDFFDAEFNEIDNAGQYKDYIEKLNKTLNTKKSTSKEKILTYIKSGLDGDKFSVDDNELNIQSDGTNTFHYLRKYLKIIIEISKREFISPIVFVDEPEIGLHPKMSEELISDIYDSYGGRTNFPNRRATIFFNTHSQNIVKEIIRSFRKDQSIYSFSKAGRATRQKKLTSICDNESLLNRFNDNEARLFFSDFILFVEGETELEVFGNRMLREKFKNLKKVDIYKTSDVKTSKQVNPYQTNASTPFLYLYDADKIIQYNVEGDSFLKLSLRNEISTVRKFGSDFLLSEHRKYSMGYSYEYRELAKKIKFILSSIEGGLKLNSKKQTSDFNHNYFINILNSYLKTKNTIINKSTFEGVLVNGSSVVLFLKWISLKFPETESAIKRLSKFKMINDDFLANYIRLYLGGKTDILTTKNEFGRYYAKKNKIKDQKECENCNFPVTCFECEKDDTSKKICKTSSFLYQKLKRELFKDRIPFGNKNEKANGWATEYLDFCIEQIENEADDSGEDFVKLFSFYFKDLYDIISRLRSDSCGESI